MLKQNIILDPKYKLVIFDCDQTLISETIFDDVFEILKQFQNSHINMAVASYNPYAKWLCDRYDITKYFDIICGYASNGKMKHIDEIKLYYRNRGINFNDSEIIFFDDDIKNFDAIKKLTNIKCIPVNPHKGITKDVIQLVI